MSLKTCKPGECSIQMPSAYIEEIRQSTDWSAPDVVERINQVLGETALGRLSAYQREGNQTLGAYNDKQNPVKSLAAIKAALEYNLSQR